MRERSGARIKTRRIRRSTQAFPLHGPFLKTSTSLCRPIPDLLLLTMEFGGLLLPKGSINELERANSRAAGISLKVRRVKRRRLYNITKDCSRDDMKENLAPVDISIC